MSETWRKNVIFRATSQKHCMEQWMGVLDCQESVGCGRKKGEGREGITPAGRGVRCSNITSVCSCLLLPVLKNWWVSSIIGFWNVHFYTMTFFLSYCDKDSFPPVSDWAHREDGQRPTLEAGTILNLASQEKNLCSFQLFKANLSFIPPLAKRSVLSL